MGAGSFGVLPGGGSVAGTRGLSPAELELQFLIQQLQQSQQRGGQAAGQRGQGIAQFGEALNQFLTQRKVQEQSGLVDQTAQAEAAIASSTATEAEFPQPIQTALNRPVTTEGRTISPTLSPEVKRATTLRAFDRMRSGPQSQIAGPDGKTMAQRADELERKFLAQEASRGLTPGQTEAARQFDRSFDDIPASEIATISLAYRKEFGSDLTEEQLRSVLAGEEVEGLPTGLSELIADSTIQTRKEGLKIDTQRLGISLAELAQNQQQFVVSTELTRGRIANEAERIQLAREQFKSLKGVQEDEAELLALKVEKARRENSPEFRKFQAALQAKQRVGNLEGEAQEFLDNAIVEGYLRLAGMSQEQIDGVIQGSTGPGFFDDLLVGIANFFPLAGAVGLTGGAEDPALSVAPVSPVGSVVEEVFDSQGTKIR